jgi:transposase
VTAVTHPNNTSTAPVSIENVELKLEVISLKAQLTRANALIKIYEEQIHLAKLQKFAKRSEKTQNLTLPLFDEQENDEVVETIEPLDEEREQVTYSRRKPKVGRKLDTSKLPREQRIYDLPEADKICGCGNHLEKMGQESSEQLEYIPAVLKVIEHIKIKYTCRHCETITSQSKPESPLPKSMASSSLISDVIIKKYDHHLPLYRQSQIFAQEGIDIPDNTLGNWVMGAATVLEPLGVALWQQLMKVHQLQADETTVKILKPEQKGYWWGYHSLEENNRFIVFEFSLTRGAVVANARLSGYSGILQTDGYSGYNDLRAKSNITAAGCWDHARRKFTDCIKVTGHDEQSIAAKFLKLINKLYKIERDCKAASSQQRLKTRQERAKPIIESLLEQAKKVNAPPKSALAKAITYIINQYDDLSTYLSYDIPISNCLIENHIRPFALGRKNWLFVGNEVAANKSALLYSLIQTCKINHINPKQYLIFVLNQVHAMRRGEIDPVSLLPQFVDPNLLSM